MTTDIDTILKQFEPFGVNLGLRRIERLLAELDNPEEKVPMIHVAGTNGKGSVCAYLSAILTAAGYRVGRYTSPHLIDWTECICLNEKPIACEDLWVLLEQVKDAIKPEAPCPTQFEVITAAAWLYFAQQEVDIAVMEVGLGGRLDATNVCDRPLVTIITSISWDHWQVLGPTLADIAGEKAGILKPGCPAICGPLPPEANTVVKERMAQLGCPGIFPEAARMVDNYSTPLETGLETGLVQWAVCCGIKYPLPLLGEVQLTNSALAIAALQVLREQGWQISDEQIARGMEKTRWPGRLQWVNWQYGENGDQTARLLIDGAHNAAAAKVLRQYVDRYLDSLSPQAVNWVMGMLETKDHVGVFQELLRPGDRLYLLPVQDWNYAQPEYLQDIAYQVCPELTQVSCCPDLAIALAKSAANLDNLSILCGSLYLLGHFLATQNKFIDG